MLGSLYGIRPEISFGNSGIVIQAEVMPGVALSVNAATGVLQHTFKLVLQISKRTCAGQCGRRNVRFRRRIPASPSGAF